MLRMYTMRWTIECKTKNHLCRASKRNARETRYKVCNCRCNATMSLRKFPSTIYRSMSERSVFGGRFCGREKIRRIFHLSPTNGIRRESLSQKRNRSTANQDNCDIGQKYDTVILFTNIIRDVVVNSLRDFIASIK